MMKIEPDKDYTIALTFDEVFQKIAFIATHEAAKDGSPDEFTLKKIRNICDIALEMSDREAYHHARSTTGLDEE